MAKVRPTISSEFSAQRRSHAPNPGLVGVLRSRGDKTLGVVADVGCGKLRHYSLLQPRSRKLFLVDTASQLDKAHTDAGVTYTVRAFAATERAKGRRVAAVDTSEFGRASLRLDTAFCVAVFDVVTRRVRKEILLSVARNLKRTGEFWLITPRNDTSILRRCSLDNQYEDGHTFAHHGLTTFFRNFADVTSILRDAEEAGLELCDDHSRYRQSVLLFRPFPGKA